MRGLAKLRKRVVQSPLGRVIRATGLHRVLDAPYEAMLRASGPMKVPFRGRTVLFRVTSKEEASFLSGHWEMEAVERLVDLLRPGDVVWDMGANIGLYSCLVGALRDDVTIHAFEPDPVNAARLRENVGLNNLGNVTVHEVALSDERGKAKFFVSGDVCSVTSSLVGKHFDHEANQDQSVEVETWPPEAFASAHGLEPPTVVKCDVEGAEGAVIQSMTGWLDAGRIRWLDVEFHRDTLTSMGLSVEGVERLILDRGYVCTNRIERPTGTHPVLATYESPAPAAPSSDALASTAEPA